MKKPLETVNISKYFIFFKKIEKKKLIIKYKAPNIKILKSENLKKNNKDIIAKNNEMKIAVLDLIRPLAKGLNFLDLCFLSISKSVKSLIIYIDEAKKLKNITGKTNLLKLAILQLV